MKLFRFLSSFCLPYLALSATIKLRAEEPPPVHVNGTARFENMGMMISPVTYLDLTLVFNKASLVLDLIEQRAQHWLPHLDLSGDGDLEKEESRLIRVHIGNKSAPASFLDAFRKSNRYSEPSSNRTAELKEKFNLSLKEIIMPPLTRLRQAHQDLDRSLHFGDRQERSLVLGLLIGAVVGAVGSALYSNHQINDLQEASIAQNGMIEALAHGQDQIFDILRENEDRRLNEGLMQEEVRRLATQIDHTALHVERLIAASYDLLPRPSSPPSGHSG